MQALTSMITGPRFLSQAMTIRLFCFCTSQCRCSSQHDVSKLFCIAEELEDLVDVVNDLKNKDEEVAQLKSFQEVQAAELTKVRKDFHKLERDSKDTLEKSEYKSKKDLQTASTKVTYFFLIFLLIFDAECIFSAF